MTEHELTEHTLHDKKDFNVPVNRYGDDVEACLLYTSDAADE